MPNLSAVTVCLWMKTADTRNEGTPLSYVVSGGREELLLYNYRNFRVFINNHHSGYTSVSANDGKWHHICLTWENTAGSWKLFRDGSVAASGKSFQTGKVIRANGSLVLGQEQDSKGGKFEAIQSFIGEMTGVNIWDHVIKDREIARMSKSCLTGVGNVFQWREFKAHIKGSVKIIKPSC
nr:neuronal pentraxin-2-like [Pocillopora verrucosa]